MSGEAKKIIEAEESKAKDAAPDKVDSDVEELSLPPPPAQAQSKAPQPLHETPIVSLEPKHILGAADIDFERKVCMPNGYNYAYNPSSNVNWDNHHYHMVTADPGPVCCGGRDCCPWLYN